MRYKLLKQIVVIFSVIITLLFLDFIISKSYASYISNDINNIDESKYPGYKEKIQQIKSKYPNWSIKLLYTQLDWNTVIDNESTGHGTTPKSLIYDTYDPSWRCMHPECVNKKFDVSQRWYCASRAAIEYMMDPRNSLDEDYIFQFQNLASSLGDREAVKKMTEGSFLYNDSYIDAIMTAAKNENLSPFHIVARIKQEQGTDGSGKMNGYSYQTETGEFIKVYNLFNINVSGNDTQARIFSRSKVRI